MFGLQHPLTCKPWTTLSNPCNKVRGKNIVKEVFMRPSFLRLPSFVCLNHGVVVMLHEHVNDYITRDGWMHTHRSNGVVFLENLFAFLFYSPRSKSSLVYIISWTPTQSFWLHLPLMHHTWTHLMSSMPPTQLTWYFLWGSSVLFTLENRCTSCYASHATYAAFLLGHHPVYLRKQACILLCHRHNLCDMSGGFSGQYSTIIVYHSIFKTLKPYGLIYIYIYIYIYI